MNKNNVVGELNSSLSGSIESTLFDAIRWIEEVQKKHSTNARMKSTLAEIDQQKIGLLSALEKLQCMFPDEILREGNIVPIRPNTADKKMRFDYKAER